MTPEERDELRAAAEAATPEPWSFGENPGWRGGVMAVFGGEGKPLGTCRRLADAYYIAGASPDTILGLLDALAAAEAEAGEYRRLSGVFIQAKDAAEAERDALTATLARIEAWARQIADRYDDAWEHTGTCLGDGGDSGACPLCLILAACGDRRIEDALDAEAGEPVTPEPPRAEVATIEERDALPAGVVVRSAAGTIACRHHSGRGLVFGDSWGFDWSALALPLTVLWAPGAEAGEQ